MKEIKVGDRFGKLTVIEEPKFYSSRKMENPIFKVRCRCDCGNEVLASVDRLLLGKITECQVNEHKGSNLIGKRFGAITVIGKAKPYRRVTHSGDYIYFYECRCDCGKLKELSTCAIRSATDHCTCDQRVRRGNFGKGKRKFNIWENKTGRAIAVNEPIERCCQLMGVKRSSFVQLFGRWEREHIGHWTFEEIEGGDNIECI